jgi:hypothetical protein
MEDDDMESIPEKESEEVEKKLPEIAIIENQLMVITSLADLDINLYPGCVEDRIRVMVRALNVIHKIQGNLLKDLTIKKNTPL